MQAVLKDTRAQAGAILTDFQGAALHQVSSACRECMELMEARLMRIVQGMQADQQAQPALSKCDSESLNVSQCSYQCS